MTHIEINLLKMEQENQGRECKWPGCKRRIVLKTNLTKHEKFWCPFRPRELKRRNRYSCHICGYSSGSPQQHQRHLLTHQPRQFACRFCDQKFTMEHTRNNHEVKKHNWTCQFCEFRTEHVC